MEHDVVVVLFGLVDGAEGESPRVHTQRTGHIGDVADLRATDRLTQRRLFDDVVLVVVFVVVFVVVLVRHGSSLDDEAFGICIPAEGQTADAERLVDRLIERIHIVCFGDGRQILDAAALEFIDELPETVGEDGHLDLLEAHADDPAAVARLEEEGPLAGQANRPGNEPVGGFENELSTTHVPNLPDSGRGPAVRRSAA